MRFYLEKLYWLIFIRLIRFIHWAEWFCEFTPHPQQKHHIFFEPFSATAFFISLAISAASFGAQLLVSQLLKPKAKPQVRGKLTGEITLTDSIFGAHVTEIYGGAPGSGDGLGGMEVGSNIFWCSDIREIRTQVPGGGGGGGGGGKGGGGSNAPANIQLNYKIDLAAGVGRGPLRLLRLKFNEDTVYGGTGGGTGTTPDRYEAEDAALSGGAATAPDTACSNNLKVVGIGNGGTVTFQIAASNNFGPGDPPIDPDPREPIPHYFFDIRYKSAGDTQAYVKLNGTGGIYSFPDTAGAVGSKVVSRLYGGGTSSVEISNPGAAGPEIDCMDVTVEDIYEQFGRQTGIRDDSFPPEKPQDNLLLPDPNASDTNASERFNAPAPVAVGGVMEITLVNGAILAWYEGTETQPIDAVIAANLGAGSTPAFRGTAYARIKDLDFTKYGSVPNLRFLVENIETRTVAEICLDLAVRSGLQPTDLDLTAAAARKVRGYVISGIQPAAKTFEELGLMHYLSFAESSDGRILARDLADRTPKAQIRAADLGAYVADGEAEVPADDLVSTMVDESTDLVRSLEIEFYNPALPADFGTDHAKFVYPYTSSNRAETQKVNALLTKTEAAAIVRRKVQENHLKTAPISLKLPYKYAGLEPGECFDVEIEGALQRFRLEEKTGSAPGVFECSATNENLVVTADAPAPNPLPPVITFRHTTAYARVNFPANTVGTILDLPPLEDAQNGKSGVYVAACPRNPGGNWTAATVYRMKGADYQQVAVIKNAAVMGRLVGAFGDVPAGLADGATDTVSSFTVDFFGKTAPTSVTEAQSKDGANACIVGSEVVTVQTWTRDNAFPNRWTGSNIIRKLRNTDKFAPLHTNGERVVILTDAVRFVPLERDEIGVSRIWKFVTSGADIADAAPVTYAWTGENLVQGKNTEAAANKTLGAADHDKTIVNTNAAALLTLTLPAAVEELEYNFVVTNAFGIRLNAPAVGRIRFGTNQTAVAGFIKSVAVGSSLTVRAVGGFWTVTNSGGAWEVN